MLFRILFTLYVAGTNIFCKCELLERRVARASGVSGFTDTKTGFGNDLEKWFSQSESACFTISELVRDDTSFPSRYES